MIRKNKAIPHSKIRALSSEEKLAKKFKEAYAFHQVGKDIQAQKSYEEILEINPKHFDALHLLGVILTKTNPQRALELIGNAIEINPALPQCFVNASNALIKLKQYELAINCCHQALALQDDSWRAHGNLGIALLKMKRTSEAIASFDRALLGLSDDAKIYMARGSAYESRYQFDLALQDYSKALELNPKYPEAHSSRGCSLFQLGYFEDALQSHNRAIELNPYLAEAHTNKAILLLMMGNLELGWDEYRWRLKNENPDFFPYQTTRPYLDVAEFNSRILVLSEQGIGDHIFFAKFLRELRLKAREVVARIDCRLIRLFQRTMPDIHFIPEGLTISEELYDQHLFIGDLPKFFGNSKEKFSFMDSSYLCADKERAKSIRDELCPESDILIGISWKSKNVTLGEKRSLDLTAFSEALNIPKIKLVNLQYGDVSADISIAKSETGVDVLQCSTVDNMNDLDGLASLIEACDLVISADNTTVHLAGALGKTLWVCLPAIPNWRWMMDAVDSYWYPSAKLYRQKELGVWSDVLADIRRDCLRLVEVN
jgi:tetratricopeptide (TPR) repeat protein